MDGIRVCVLLLFRFFFFLGVYVRVKFCSVLRCECFSFESGRIGSREVDFGSSLYQGLIVGRILHLE